MTTKTESELRELRALDAWIAEHLFGFQWFEFTGKAGDKWTSLVVAGTWIKRHNGKQVDCPKDLATADTGSVPHYSTDPAAAMMVLERLLDSGEKFTAWKGVLPSGDRAYCFDSRNKHVYEDASTLPLAIALFAKALFGKEK